MEIDIVTKEELRKFKEEIIESIKELFPVQVTRKSEEDRWMRSAEVRKLFGISAATLQNMRVNGSLPYSRMGTTILYDRNKILETLEKNSIHKKQS